MSPHRNKNLRRPAGRGVAVVYMALVMLVLIGVLGLAIDTGYVFLTAHQLQNAADAAALAGADEVAFNTVQASSDAMAEASKNSAAHAPVTLAAANDVFVGNYNRDTSTFTADMSPYNACKVIARRTTGSANGPLNLLFAPIFGITTAEVSRQAIAMNSRLEPGVLLLSPSASPAIQLTGTGSNPDKIVVTNGGAVVVNSGSTTAVQWSGNPDISAKALYIVGNDAAVSSGGVFTGTLSLNAPYMADPLASLPAPARPANTVTSKEDGKWPPGYYPAGLPAGTLAGGLYYVDNGITLNDEKVDGTAGAMIYLHTGGISLDGNSAIIMNAMTDGFYAGISYFEDRANTSSIDLNGNSKNQNGNSDDDDDDKGKGSGKQNNNTGQGSGTMYFPSAQVSITGNSTGYANQLIAGTLVIQGNAQLNINYDGRNAIIRHQAFLVR